MKDKIIQDAKEHFARVYEPRVRNKAQACLFWAASAQWALEHNEFQGRSMLVAGSVSFQMRVKDDGVSDTHFSYMFESQAAAKRISIGLLPEMHVWLVTFSKDIELIDLSTGFQREQCERILGTTFDKELIPPPYLWCSTSAIPPQFIYRPDLFATEIAMSVLDSFHGRPAKFYRNITCRTNKVGSG